MRDASSTGTGGSSSEGGMRDGAPPPASTEKVTITIQRGGKGTVTGNGVTCDTDGCTASVEVGSNLVLTAQPDTDSEFRSWADCTSSNGATCSLTNITAPTQVTVTFVVKNANFVVLKDGNGSGTVAASWQGGSLSCGAECSAVIPQGTAVTLQITPNAGSMLAANSACSAGSSTCTVTIGVGETTIMATFTLAKVTLTVKRVGSGTITGTGGISCADPECSVPVNYGSSVTLVAVPAGDYGFQSWSGCTATNGVTCSVSSVKAAAEVTATFVLKKVSLTIQRNGQGKVTGTGGINCTDTSCAIFVDAGSTVSLEAVPDADSEFKSWSGCTTTSGTTCTVSSIQSPTQVSATFALKNASLIISRQGNGSGMVTANWSGGSINCGATCSAAIPQGTMVTLQATPQPESTFVWSGPCTGSGSCVVTTTAAATTVTATFSLVKYGLTIERTGVGTVTGTGGINCTTFPCSVSLDSGASVTLTAQPAADYDFASWSGCTSTTGTACAVTNLKQAARVTANFTIKKYPLTIQRSGTGTVTGSGGVNCTDLTCVVSVDSGSTITLDAHPGTDFDFASWTGCPSAMGATCTISSIQAATQVTASFVLKNATFNIAKGGNGSGTVNATWAGGSLSCGATCSATIPAGTQVTLTATPQTGSTFLWGAPCSGTGSCIVTVGSGGTTVAATFTLNQYLLSVALAGPAGAGTVVTTTPGVSLSCGQTSCSSTVNHGTSVQLVATPSATGVFVSWVGCSSLSGATCNVTVTSPTSVTATFKTKTGGFCTNPSDCSLGFCVGGICCGTACTGACNDSCPSGTCLPKPKRTACGTATQANPGSNDVTLLCDGAGNCAGPTLACGGSPCSIGQDTCCSALVNSSEQLSCVTPASQSNSQCCGGGNGLCPSNQRAGTNCMGTHDCPLGQVCCVTGGFGYEWVICQTACTQSQVCDPAATPSECPSGTSCTSSGNPIGPFVCL